MKAQPPSFQVGLYALLPLLKPYGVVMKERKIIDMSDIAFDPEDFLAKVVESVEVQVGEKLAGEVADRQATPTLQGREKIITREMQIDRLLLVGAVNDSICQSQCPPASNAAAQILLSIS